MKIRIEIDDSLKEEEVIIRSREWTDEVQKLQEAISGITKSSNKFVFYKNETEFFLALDTILFFETSESEMLAHTRDEIYKVRYRLYELEELLPGFFMRVSKSTILNTKCIHSISRSVSTPCLVQFQNTHKQVYVSRFYYKPLRNRLEEKR